MYGTSTAVGQTTGRKRSCGAGRTYRIQRTDMDMAQSGSLGTRKDSGMTYTLSADPEVAPLELPEDLQELLEEPGDLRC